MPVIVLEDETDFAGWRRAARALAENGVRPSEVAWDIGGQRQAVELPRGSAPPRLALTVPRHFLRLARAAILHRDAARFALLYRLLWRLRGDRDLLANPDDADVAQTIAMADAVDRDIRRMQTQLRFREIGREQKAHYVAWFAPDHRIIRVTAPFFASRFADMPWSILTRDACAHWDGHAVSITPGLMETPETARLEETWRRIRQHGFFGEPGQNPVIKGKTR